MATVPIIISGDDDLREKFDRLQGSILGQKMMSEIGAFAVAMIDSRTSEGKDFRGKPFKGYSPKYKLFRAKFGRPVNKVDFNFFGTMMIALTYKSESKEVQIYFLPTPDERNPKITSPEKAFFLNQKRKFFGLNATDVRKIKAIIEQYIEKAFD
jgi:hypothetical protein